MSPLTYVSLVAEIRPIAVPEAAFGNRYDAITGSSDDGN